VVGRTLDRNNVPLVQRPRLAAVRPAFPTSEKRQDIDNVRRFPRIVLTKPLPQTQLRHQGEEMVCSRPRSDGYDPQPGAQSDSPTGNPGKIRPSQTQPRLPVRKLASLAGQPGNDGDDPTASLSRK